MPHSATCVTAASEGPGRDAPGRGTGRVPEVPHARPQRRDLAARRGLTRLLQNRQTDANLDFNTFRKLAPGDVNILEMLIAAVTKGASK